MARIGWRFPPLSGGNKQAYTKQDIECFKGEELMDNLAREICQNSLDAVSPNAVAPVKIVFESKEIESTRFPLFKEYHSCIRGCRDFWGDNADKKLTEFLNGAEKTLAGDRIALLIASDYNTKGLSGSRVPIAKSTWEALTSSDGLSVKPGDTSAGSYGVGKNAPFACSSLSMVFYNTYSEEDHDKAFIGVARVASLFNENRKPTQGVGKYQKNDDSREEWLPIYEEDEDKFRDLFVRDKYGSDVIVVGFNKTDKWKDYIKTAIIKNFFIAILEGKLEVELKQGDAIEAINASTISQTISELPPTTDLRVISQLYKAFTSPDKVDHLSILEDNDVDVYVKVDANYSRIIAELRNTGMLVRVRTKRLFQHYAALVIVRGKKISELLRDTEPARHNKWDYKIIPDTEPDRRRDAKAAIDTLNTKVLEIINKQFETDTSESMDAVGVSDYLPDENPTELGDAVAGDDALKVKVKIGRIRNDKPNPDPAFVSGHPGVGDPVSGDYHNNQTRPPHPIPPTPRPPVVVPTPDPKPPRPPKPGIVAGNGTKVIRMPNLTAQRAFPINSSMGLYRIMIMPAQNYDNIYVECSATGEDGTADDLKMESFTYNGSSIKIEGSKAGPVSVEAEKPAMFFVRFESKEKMLLKLNITEEVDVK